MVKAKVTSQITIDAKPAEVFKYLVRLKYHYLWNPHLQDISPQSDLTLGSKYKTVSLMLGIKIKGQNHVTKFIQDKEMQIENTTGLVLYTVNYQLTNGSKTKLVCSISVSADKKAFAFAKPVLKMLAQRELQTDLKALKIAAEQGLN